MNRYLAVLLIAVPLRIGYADDLPLVSGKVYTDVKITRVDPDGLMIRHSSGISKVYFHELSEDVQQQYNYNPLRARQYTQQYEAQQAQIQLNQQNEMKKARIKAEAEHRVNEAAKLIEKAGLSVVGRVSQVTEDGILLREARTPYSWKEEVVTPGFRPMDGNRQFRTRTKYVPLNDDDEPIMIVGEGRGFADGEPWSGVIYPAGTYQYTTVMGAIKTVRKYGTTPYSALTEIVNE